VDFCYFTQGSYGVCKSLEKIWPFSSWKSLEKIYCSVSIEKENRREFSKYYKFTVNYV